MTTENVPATIVEIFEKQPTRAGWLDACRVIESLAASDAGSLSAVLDYVEERDWPARLRMAPMLWINRLLAGALPVEALRIVSGLHLLAALHPSDRKAERLVEWVRSLDAESTPAVDGISLSSRVAHLEAEAAAVEREDDTRLHPAPRLMVPSRVHHYGDRLVTALLESPLCVRLRVFDASVDTTFEEEAEMFSWHHRLAEDPSLTREELESSQSTYGDSQEAWDFFRTSGISVDKFVRKAPKTLEAVDLHGQIKGIGRTFNVPWIDDELASLRFLNVGGGKHPAAADLETLGKLVAGSPIQALNTSADPSFFDLEEHVRDLEVEAERESRASLVGDDWEEEAIGAMVALVESLAERETPPEVVILPHAGMLENAADVAGDAIELQARDERRPDEWRAPFPSDWTAHFEL